MFELVDQSKLLPLKGALKLDPDPAREAGPDLRRRDGAVREAGHPDAGDHDRHATERHARGRGRARGRPEDTEGAGHRDARPARPVPRRIGGQLVASTSQKGIEDFRSGGPSSRGDSIFQQAQKGVGDAGADHRVPVRERQGRPAARPGLRPPPGPEAPAGPPKRPIYRRSARWPPSAPWAGDEQSYTVYLQVQ